MCVCVCGYVRVCVYVWVCFVSMFSSMIAITLGVRCGVVGQAFSIIFRQASLLYGKHHTELEQSLQRRIRVQLLCREAPVKWIRSQLCLGRAPIRWTWVEMTFGS